MTTNQCPCVWCEASRVRTRRRTLAEFAILAAILLAVFLLIFVRP